MDSSQGISPTLSTERPGSTLHFSGAPTRSLDQQWLAMALEAGGMGVWEWDLASGKSAWNPQMYQLLGVAPELTQPAAEVFMNLVHPEDREGLNIRIAQALACRGEFSGEVRMTRADTGEQRWIAARGRTLCDAAGEPVSMIGVNFDITEETHNQEKLKAAAQRRADFLAVLGHELRNPLAPLAYIARKLEGSSTPGSEQSHAAQVIQRQVGQLTRLVNDLLEVSRIELGKIALHKKPLLVEEVIQAAVEAVMPTIRAKEQVFTMGVPSGIAINADPARLTQVVTNLLSNAAKFTPAGGHLHIEVAPLADTVSIKVQDNGPGIEANLLPLLFEPFTQGLATIDRTKDGLGIGLSIVKRLVELHGGTVKVSTSSQGSTFTVELPMLPSHPGPMVNAPELIPGEVGHRILVVEDNRDAAALLAEVLQGQGHQVEVVHDGQEGLDKARECHPQVMLVDIGLPSLDGWSLAQHLRSEPSGKDLVLIAMSGYGQASDIERSAQAGFDLHLTKPADIAQLLSYLDGLPAHRGAAAASAA